MCGVPKRSTLFRKGGKKDTWGNDHTRSVSLCGPLTKLRPVMGPNPLILSMVIGVNNILSCPIDKNDNDYCDPDEYTSH